jgi:hypothetical protein
MSREQNQYKNTKKAKKIVESNQKKSITAQISLKKLRKQWLSELF